MHQLNNLDVIILIVIGISALIALSRGLIKEVLSIIGWVLGVAAIVYLLPVLTPFAKLYIESGWLAGIVTSLCILILFLIFWIMFTGKIIGKIRKSKLNGIDRFLGLFFGIARAFLLIILFNIMVNWMIPEENQSEVITDSRYFKIAGSFAKPIEELIPEKTLQIIRDKTGQIKPETDKKSEKVEKKEEKNKSKPIKETLSSDSDVLFQKLTQPQIKSSKKEKAESKKTPEKSADKHGYKESERDNLDRLIENTLE